MRMWRPCPLTCHTLDSPSLPCHRNMPKTALRCPVKKIIPQKSKFSLHFKEAKNMKRPDGKLQVLCEKDTELIASRSSLKETPLVLHNHEGKAVAHSSHTHVSGPHPAFTSP